MQPDYVTPHLSAKSICGNEELLAFAFLGNRGECLTILCQSSNKQWSSTAGWYVSVFIVCLGILSFAVQGAHVGIPILDHRRCPSLRAPTQTPHPNINNSHHSHCLPNRIRHRSHRKPHWSPPECSLLATASGVQTSHPPFDMPTPPRIPQKHPSPLAQCPI